MCVTVLEGEGGDKENTGQGSDPLSTEINFPALGWRDTQFTKQTYLSQLLA